VTTGVHESWVVGSEIFCFKLIVQSKFASEVSCGLDVTIGVGIGKDVTSVPKISTICAPYKTIQQTERFLGFQNPYFFLHTQSKEE
jgi:hypothetical protein